MDEKILWLILITLVAVFCGGFIWYVRRCGRLSEVGFRLESLAGGQENAERLLRKAEEDANLMIAAGLSMGAFGLAAPRKALRTRPSDGAT